MKLFKLLTLALLLVLGSLSVSAATFDGRDLGFPRFSTFGRDNYDFQHYGSGGFDARNIRDNQDNAYLFGNLFSRDFTRNYADQSTFDDRLLAGYFQSNVNQGTRGYRNDFTESYGTCEPGEKTFRQRTVITTKVYPLQTNNDDDQRRSLRQRVIRSSGCNGYRSNRVQSDFLVDNFNNQYSDGRLQQRQDQSSFSDLFSEDVKERELGVNAGASSSAYNQDSYIPFRGTRRIFNPYY